MILLKYYFEILQNEIVQELIEIMKQKHNMMLEKKTEWIASISLNGSNSLQSIDPIQTLLPT